MAFESGTDEKYPVTNLPTLDVRNPRFDSFLTSTGRNEVLSCPDSHNILARGNAMEPKMPYGRSSGRPIWGAAILGFHPVMGPSTLAEREAPNGLLVDLDAEARSAGQADHAIAGYAHRIVHDIFGEIDMGEIDAPIEHR